MVALPAPSASASVTVRAARITPDRIRRIIGNGGGLEPTLGEHDDPRVEDLVTCRWIRVHGAVLGSLSVCLEEPSHYHIG